MQSEELDWLQEMMRLTGVESEAEEEEYPPLLPGMLLPEDEEAEQERLLREKFRLAEEQTIELTRQQQALHDEEALPEDGFLHEICIES